MRWSWLRKSVGPFLIAAACLSPGGLRAQAAPMAVFDVYFLDQDTPFAVAAAAGLLANDTDAGGGALIVKELAASPRHGTLSWTSNGAFTYQPAAGFSGTDSFRYIASNGAAASQPALVILSVEPAAFGGTSGAWTTFGNGPAHTGVQRGFVGDRAPTPIWEKDIPETYGMKQPVVANGRVFLVPVYSPSPHRLFALDGRSGTELWQLTFDVHDLGPPTFADGSVYLQVNDHSRSRLWSIDAETGAARWTAPYDNQWFEYYAPVVADGHVFSGGGFNSGVYGFDQASGSRLFFAAHGDNVDAWTPLYHDRRLLTWRKNALAEHDPASGAVTRSLDVEWSGPFTLDQYAVPVAAGDTAYLQGSPSLLALDLATLTIAWQASVADKGTPAVADGLVYAVEADRVSVFDAATGRAVTSLVAPEPLIPYEQPILTDDKVIVSSPQRVFVFERFTGRLQHTITGGGKLALAENVLYVGSYGPVAGDGYLRSRISAWLLSAPERATDAAPFVANPIGELVVNRNSGPVTVDLARVISDPDDSAGSIYYAVTANTNANQVPARIVGTTLTLGISDFPGESAITIRANSAGKIVESRFAVRIDNPDLTIELFDDSGRPVAPGATVAGVVTGMLTATNRAGFHVQFYQNFRTLAPNEHGHMVTSPIWRQTFRVDTSKFFDGENLISVHAHPMGVPGQPYSTTFDVGRFKIVTANGNPAPNGDIELPRLTMDEERFTTFRALAVPGHTLNTLTRSVAILDDAGQIEMDQRLHSSDQAQVIAHIGTSVLGRFRWVDVTPPFGDSPAAIFNGVHLLPFQRDTEYTANVVFFLNDAAGRANYGFHSFRMPALSAADRQEYSLPALDAVLLNAEQGDEIIVPANGAYMLRVEVRNVSPLAPKFPRLTTWIGNRAVTQTDLRPTLASLTPGLQSFVVDVPIPGAEIAKLEATRQGGLDNSAFAIWVDFAEDNDANLPTSEHQHLAMIRTDALAWPHGQDDDGDGFNAAGDNCGAVANADQVDRDNDGLGDACDLDDDGDGILDVDDTRPIPDATILTMQGGRAATTVFANSGKVESSSFVMHAVGHDAHHYRWTASSPSLTPTEGFSSPSFTFDPSALPSGLYRLEATVQDHVDHSVTNQAESLIRVAAAAPALAMDVDADGDGVSDVDEGYADDDLDRIPNYLDAVDRPNRLPAEEPGAVLEARADVQLRLGEIAFASGKRSALIDWRDLEQHGGVDGRGAPTTADFGYYHVLGVFDFEATLLAPGASVDVVVPLALPLPAASVYRKYQAGFGWSGFVAGGDQVASAAASGGTCPAPSSGAFAPGLTPGHSCVRLTLADGGANDADRTVNGVVSFTGSPAVTNSPPPVVTVTPLSPPSTTVSRSGGEQVLLGFVVDSDSLDAVIHELTLRASGSIDAAADLDAMSLYLDGNANGMPEVAERIARAPLVRTDGQLVFTLDSPRRLPAGSTRFLVTNRF